MPFDPCPEKRNFVFIFETYIDPLTNRCFGLQKVRLDKLSHVMNSLNTQAGSNCKGCIWIRGLSHEFPLELPGDRSRKKNGSVRILDAEEESNL